MPEQAFDQVGEQFLSYYEQVRGYVRQELTRRYLGGAIEDEMGLGARLRILDIGGGDAGDAIWLARYGHSVDVIEPSKEMSNKAQEKVERGDFAGIVSIYPMMPDEFVENSEPAQYDVVMSHGVLMYLVDEPERHLELIGSQVKQDGLVSILTKGMDGSMVRLVQQGQFDALRRLNRTGYMVNNLGQEVLAVNRHSMEALLGRTGLTLAAMYGVRIASENDRRAIEEVDKDELRLIVDIEAFLGRGDDTKGLGQMLHFICKPAKKENGNG